MADTVTNNVQQNGFRNIVLKLTNVSDGTGQAGAMIYDATSANTLGQNPGVSIGGQTFYSGLHTTIVKMHYDITDMKVRLQWQATTNQDIIILGAAPGPMEWQDIGGLRVPAGLAGATGSILLTTIGASPNSTYDITLYLRKNIVT